MTYVQFLLAARADIAHDAFVDGMTAHFMIKLLHGYHYDLSKFHLPAFIGFIEHSISYFFAKMQTISLFELIRNLRVNGGLGLIKHTNGIIARTLRHNALTNTLNASLTFIQILISANMKYKLDEYQVTIMAASLNCWFVANNKQRAILQMLNFISNRFFAADVLVELVNIHDTYCFGDLHSNYFIAVIAELWKLKDEWTKDTTLFVFAMTFQQELLAKGLTVNHA